MGWQDEPQPPGYQLDDVTVVSSEREYRAFQHELRRRILAELLSGAASIEMLARALGRPKGTVGYHVQVLARAGLIRVLEERPVRGITEKLYGRTARTVAFAEPYRLPAARTMLHQAARELKEDPDGVVTLRHVRIPRHRALEFRARLVELTLEFIETPPEDVPPWGLAVALYPVAETEPRRTGG